MRRILSWTLAIIGLCITVYSIDICIQLKQVFQLLYFTVFSFLFSLYPVRLRYSITLSLNLTFLIYGIFVYGPEFATVSVAAQAICQPVKGRTIERGLYDFGQLVLSTFLSGLVWNLSGLSVSITHMILMGIVVCVVFYSINSVAVAMATRLFEGKAFLRVWQSLMQDASTSFLIMCGIGVCLAILDRDGVPYIIWASSPFLLAISFLIHRHGIHLQQIRDQHAKELALLEREQVLVETNRLVMENMPNAVVVIDMQGCITLLNPAAIQFFHCSPDIVGDHYSHLFSRYDKTTDFPNYIEFTILRQEEYSAQPKTFLRDGIVTQILVTTAIIREANGKPSGAIGVYTDVTKQKQLEEKYYLSEQLSALGQVAAGIAHEIRNPLTVSRGFIDLILRNPTEISSEKQLMYLSMVSKEMERMASLITEFLQQSKPGQDSKIKEVQLSSVIQQVLDFMSGEANLNNIQCITQVQSEKTILADENQLKQVFMNLIRNAFEAMPNGGKLEVLLSELAERRMNSIVIKDSGIGIEPYKLAKIFNPFFTTKDSGTGLGLSTVYQIINQLGGTIEVNSMVGVGTQFTILLPTKE